VHEGNKHRRAGAEESGRGGGIRVYMVFCFWTCAFSFFFFFFFFNGILSLRFVMCNKNKSQDYNSYNIGNFFSSSSAQKRSKARRAKATIAKEGATETPAAAG